MKHELIGSPRGVRIVVLLIVTGACERPRPGPPDCPDLAVDSKVSGAAIDESMRSGIAGIVLDPDGAPAVDAEVIARFELQDIGLRVSARTDDGGRFEFSQAGCLPDTMVRVWVSERAPIAVPSFTFNVALGSQDLVLRVPLRSHRVTVTLPRRLASVGDVSAQVHGRYLARGAPHADSAWELKIPGAAITDDEVVFCVPEGTFQFALFADGTAICRQALVSTGSDDVLMLEVPHVGLLVGVVLSDGRGVPGAFVEVVVERPASFEALPAVSPRLNCEGTDQSVVTDSEGRFQLLEDGLPAEFFIRAWKRGSGFAISRRIRLPFDAVRLELGACGSISGIASATCRRVHVWREFAYGKTGCGQNGACFVVDVADDGTFVVDDIPSGPWRVEDLSDGDLPRHGVTSAGDVIVDVMAGQTVEVDSGDFGRRYRLEAVFEQEGAIASLHRTSPDRLQVCVTEVGAGGRFVLSVARPGRYWLRIVRGIATPTIVDCVDVEDGAEWSMNGLQGELRGAEILISDWCE